MNTSSWRFSLLAAGAVFVGCAVLLLATSPFQAMGWDEGDTILRAEAIGGLDAGDRGAHRATSDPTDDAVASWPFTTRREGHPPLAGLLVALGLRVAPPWFDPLTQARFGPILWFSLAAGVMCYRLQRDYGVLAVSLMAVGALLTMPRMLAHAHFATLDGPLTAAWIMAWAAFRPACRDARWIPCFGLALGLTLCAKFTGWLAIVPVVMWTALYRDQGGLRALALGVPIALATFVALNPPLWDAPLSGLRTFFALNLDRAARPEHNITTQFFGRMYNLDYPLPWYNTLVWTAITISPMPFLVGGMGIVATLRRWRTDRASMLLVCNWATLVVVRALPWVPPHDAERLILPSFAFFAALVGVGIGRGLYRDTLLGPERIIAQGWAKVAMAIALTAATVDAIGYFPFGLSYYNRLVGGLRGATALGMEPTYYWDALDRRALDWLDEHTASDEKVAFGGAPPANLELLVRWGRLKHLPSDPGTFRWYVMQRRPSGMQPVDVWLAEHATPAFERSLSGVPLLDIYSFQDYERAQEATSESLRID